MTLYDLIRKSINKELQKEFTMVKADSVSENIFEIIINLIENNSESKDVEVCRSCDSEDIAIDCWQNVNTKEITVGDHEYYCFDCGETKSEERTLYVFDFEKEIDQESEDNKNAIS